MDEFWIHNMASYPCLPSVYAPPKTQEWLRNSVLTVRNRFRRRWLNEDIPEVDYFGGGEEDVSDRRSWNRRQLSPAARAYNVS